MKITNAMILATVISFGCVSGHGSYGSDPEGQPDTCMGTDAVDAGHVDSVQIPDSMDMGPSPDAWDWSLPDPAFVYTPKAAIKPVSDREFAKDMPIAMDDSLVRGQAIKAISVQGNTVFVGTKNAVFQVVEGVKVSLKRILQLNGPTLLAITKNPFGTGPCVITKDKASCGTDKTMALSVAVSRATADDAYVYLLTSGSLYQWDGNEITEIKGISGVLRDVTAWDKGLAVLGDQGVFLKAGKHWNLVKSGSSDLPYADCNTLDCDGKTLVVGCKGGIATLDLSDMQWRAIKAGINGLPGSDVNAISVKNGVITMAFGYGCGAMAEGHIDYYVSHRWLPSDVCTAVAVDSKGRRWFGTDKGLAVIGMEKQRVADKAAWLFQDLKDHFIRMGGFLSPLAYVRDKGYLLPDSDNDGQWTQEAIGALCFAFAVTHDSKYRNLAWQAMQNMFLLVDVPAISFEKQGMQRGFVARSLCRQDEPCFKDKKGLSNWHLVTYQGKEYYWKDDTSSDEVVGHFFGYSLYYDLCASEDQKKQVADHALALANYIVDNGFRLIDLDGKGTTDGYWEPQRLAIATDGFKACVNKYHDAGQCADAAFGGGWLNSIEILGVLLSAYHLSGDRKFFDAFKSLILQHKYWKLAMGNDQTFTITKPMLNNHCDEELAMLSFTTLLRYESAPGRRRYWLACLKWLYNRVKRARNPMHAGITAIFLPEIVDKGAGVQSLREMPARDRRRVSLDNSHRVDARHNGKDRFGRPQFDRVFPYDEIQTMWWDKNPFLETTDPGSEQTVNGPMAFLIAYWALRYAGVLQ